MFRQPVTQNNNRTTSRTAKSATLTFVQMLAFAAAIGLAFALVPVWLPSLSSFLSGVAPHTYWYISRASGFIAFGLLWLSMLAGLGITSKLARFWPGMPGSFELHRFTA